MHKLKLKSPYNGVAQLPLHAYQYTVLTADDNLIDVRFRFFTRLFLLLFHVNDVKASPGSNSDLGVINSAEIDTHIIQIT